MAEKIFSYCERGLDPSFWAEPFNAITNAAFIIAAILTTRLWLAIPGGQRGMFEGFLIVLVFAIGTGSFLFHTFAEPWAALADVIPIGIFMVSYLAYALRRYLEFGRGVIFIVLVLFFWSLRESSVLRCGDGPCLNGSLAYFPAFAALMIIGSWLIIKKHAAGWSVLGAGFIFVISLTARTLDREICAETAMIGTHLCWHILNGMLLFLLVRAALLFGHKTEKAPDIVDYLLRRIKGTHKNKRLDLDLEQS